MQYGLSMSQCKFPCKLPCNKFADKGNAFSMLLSVYLRGEGAWFWPSIIKMTSLDDIITCHTHMHTQTQLMLDRRDLLVVAVKLTSSPSLIQ